MTLTVPTKRNFLIVYESELLARQSWASDPAKLSRFMASVTVTLNGGNTWAREGEAFKATCKELGLPTRVTLKAVHALSAA